MKVKLIDEEQPMRFKGQWTFYKKGHIFEVVEEKEMPLMGKGYKLKFAGCVFEGFHNAKDFEVIEEPKFR